HDRAPQLPTRRRLIGWHDCKANGFTGIRIRYAKRYTLGNSRMRYQNPLDFGRVYLYAIHVDHVDLAIRHKEKAFVIHEPDVSYSEEVAEVGGLGLAGISKVFESVSRVSGQIDDPLGTRRHIIPGFVHNPDARTRNGLSYRSGVSEPVHRIYDRST